MRKSFAAIVLSFAFAQPSLGGEQGSVVGTWKLVSYEVEAQASGERGPVMGQSPTGYAAFLPDGKTARVFDRAFELALEFQVFLAIQLTLEMQGGAEHAGAGR